ncbi:MAG TPA: hypothetical protein VIT92_00080, partial [Burkholderiaceae bacterium]
MQQRDPSHRLMPDGDPALALLRAGAWRYDRARGVIAWSAAAAAALGADAAMDETLAALLARIGAPGGDALAAALQSGQPFDLELCIARGSRGVWLRCAGAPVDGGMA